MNIIELNQKIKDGAVYLYDDINEACLKVYLKEGEKRCELKHRGKAPVVVHYSYPTAFDIMLGGKEIAEKDYKDF